MERRRRYRSERAYKPSAPPTRVSGEGLGWAQPFEQPEICNVGKVPYRWVGKICCVKAGRGLTVAAIRRAWTGGDVKRGIIWVHNHVRVAKLRCDLRNDSGGQSGDCQQA